MPKTLETYLVDSLKIDSPRGIRIRISVFRMILRMGVSNLIKKFSLVGTLSLFLPRILSTYGNLRSISAGAINMKKRFDNFVFLKLESLNSLWRDFLEYLRK